MLGCSKSHKEENVKINKPKVEIFVNLVVLFSRKSGGKISFLL